MHPRPSLPFGRHVEDAGTLAASKKKKNRVVSNCEFVKKKSKFNKHIIKEMSNVTNMILSFSVCENEEERVKEINSFSNKGKGFNITSVDFEKELTPKTRWYAGSKMIETNLFLGAYNHLDVDGLINHLKSIKWEDPEIVQLILKEEHDEKFKIVEII